MRKGFYYIVALLVLSFCWSCSTKKNTRMNRFYHALNSRFNIYFNGKTAFDEALLAMQTGYKENYSDMILMYPISAQPKDKSEPGGPFDVAIEKSNKAIKLHSIQAKPKKKPGWRNDPKQVAWQNQEEYNPFLKKCWMLMGEAQFYNTDFLQASATFSYITRHYKEDAEIVASAKLWQARCYAEMGWNYEAEDILNKLNTEGIPKKNLDQYATVYADYLIKNGQFEEAIPYMKTAIKAEKNRLQKKRMKYLLGQMYASLEMDGMAYKTFGEVIRSNPPYELEFAARIRQTEVFTGTNFQKMVKKLERMAKSQKNKDYLDQVYYALGNLYMSQEDTAQAIKSYELGVEKSTQNGLDKAMCQIKLGDIYFEKRDYIKAQPNFSGALAGIQKEYKDYERVSKLSAVLDELVVHAEAVHLQDSLQTLAKMPEKERLAVIDKIIEQVIEEEKRAQEEAEKEAFLAEQAAKGTGIDRPGTEAQTVTIPTAGGENTFYFYNPQAVAQGKTQFQRKWGRRPLEDDWRRRKKTLTTFQDPSEIEEDGEGTMEGDSTAIMAGDSASVGSDDPKSREYYLQQLPMTPEDIAASNIIIEDGLYNMAMIYKDKLEDLPLAIQAFEDLEKRFPDNQHLLDSYYQIYLMALRLKNTTLAAEYLQKMKEKFPTSDYTIAVSDPNYEYNIRMMDVVQDSIYEKTYERYLAEDTSAVRRNYRLVSEKYPLAKLLPKFMFLEALTYVQAGDPEGFKQALKALLDKYPSGDVSELAGEMLKGVLRGRQMVQGGVTGMTWNLRFGTGEDGSLSAADSARVFKADKNVPYRMVMIYPTGTIDRNQLLFSVAAYNFANFMVKQLDMTFEEAGMMSVFVLSGFYNFEEVWHYYKMIYGEGGYASALDRNIAILPISDENYETLMHG
ncbi:MAG TPA: tetratricopeptide repeat protein, partial [Candidatus Parabacteroides intestinavium]|nr:tetratricopeptide repeat protein [Candidatus Parabacteroides intestinavium]